MKPSLLIEPAGSLGAIASIVWVAVLGACVTALFASVLWRFLVYRGRSLRARSAQSQSPRLEAGPVLLRGVVETDDGGPAVRVELDQVGREWGHKGKASHEWKEKNRAVHVRPFRLRLKTGERVSVEPDARVRLVDTLETERFEGTYRRRVAELSAREGVWVSGVLGGAARKASAAAAYRAGPEAMVVRGTDAEPLEVASGNLDVQFSHWRRFHQRAAVLLGLVLFVVHGVLFAPFYLLTFTGKTEMVGVVDASSYTTSSKGRTYNHYVIRAELPAAAGGGSLKDEVSSDIYALAREGGLAVVPFTYSTAIPRIHSIGRYADLSLWAGCTALTLLITSVTALVLLRRKATPWYEQKVVIERGRGLLATQAWRRQVPGKPGLYEDAPAKGR